MGALKLFISHSSKLDGLHVDGLSGQANLNFLKSSCDLIQEYYGDRIELLVDLNLQAGDQWERRLNEWLFECHAAVFLFSLNAINKSEWVKKEAAILSARKSLDSSLKLIPILLDKQDAKVLTEGYFSTLRIQANQCVRNVTSAMDVLKGVRQALGEPENLPPTNPTLFDILVQDIKEIISRETDEHKLERLLTKLSIQAIPIGPQLNQVDRYSSVLARYMVYDGQKSLMHVQKVIDGLRMSEDDAFSLLKIVRALWVDSSAAGLIPSGNELGKFFALNGELVGLSDPTIGTQCYTLERYLERAWPMTDQIKVITLSKMDSLDSIQEELRCRFRPDFPRNRAEDAIARENKHVVVLLPAKAGNFPDHRLLEDLRAQKAPYSRLIYVFDTGAELPSEIPNGIHRIEPKLDVNTEYEQFNCEIEARELLIRKYGA